MSAAVDTPVNMWMWTTDGDNRIQSRRQSIPFILVFVRSEKNGKCNMNIHHLCFIVSENELEIDCKPDWECLPPARTRTHTRRRTNKPKT